MASTLAVPESMTQSVSAFVQAESLAVTVVADGGAVRVVAAAQGQQSAPHTLMAGGWITCATAFEMAERLEIKTHQLGKLLDHLDVKIRACQLGCFE